ncbi:MAG: efflux RND transporter periplasmic adaptor subunit [Hydrogenophaga sp.]|nr:efflux RND transporter periplasmic adaptor subunit [Hydrogenophaga sp.]
MGQEEFKHATAQLAAAKCSAEAAREQLASNQSLTDGIAVDQHPNVLRASARVREAYVALKRVELQAPVAGYVARRNVQLGQRLQAGAPLLSVIALDQVWVEANFKESQLKNLRLGQPVQLSADVYGKKVVCHGNIDGLGAGTGAAFALLPAQNATGNWIKVVQRVPVRVHLDAKELVDHPLRLGLSMEARVDVSKTDGRMLADGTSAQAAVQTAVFDQDSREADARVQALIAQHGGGARLAAPRPAPGVVSAASVIPAH